MDDFVIDVERLIVAACCPTRQAYVEHMSAAERWLDPSASIAA
jgi:hypothetical protein